jgi:hypothetical protein
MVGPSLILADFFGTTPEGIEVGVILHGRAGKISELEIYGLDKTPTSLPNVQSLRAADFRCFLPLRCSSGHYLNQTMFLSLRQAQGWG